MEQWQSLLIQLPLVGVVVVTLFYMFREFKSVLMQLSESWQAYIQRMEEKHLMADTKLAEEVSKWRNDFYHEITRRKDMKE